MLHVDNAASGAAARSPARTRRISRHHSPRILRKQTVPLDNERTAIPDNAGNKVPIQHSPLSHHYAVVSELGRGKFAVVKKVKNKDTGREYAAKFLRKRRGGKDCRDNIIHEVKMLELVSDHPRLVQLIHLFETSHELILVMEYAHGGELFGHLMEAEGFEEQEVIRLMRQVLEALEFLHSLDIVHLDIKPQNLLLTADPPTGSIKLCDFGFSRKITSQEDVRDIIGTPDYVAPEILSYEPLHTSCDMWSVGVLVYVMLTGCSPFAGDNKMETFSNITQLNLEFPAELFSNISHGAVDFIKRLLVAEPQERMTAVEAQDHPWLAINQSHATLHHELNQSQPCILNSQAIGSDAIQSSYITDESHHQSEIIDKNLNSHVTEIDQSQLVHVQTEMIDSNHYSTPESGSANETTPMALTPPSSRNSLYLSTDSLVDCESKQSRMIDSSGDELERVTAFCDVTNESTNQHLADPNANIPSHEENTEKQQQNEPGEKPDQYNTNCDNNCVVHTNWPEMEYFDWVKVSDNSGPSHLTDQEKQCDSTFPDNLDLLNFSTDSLDKIDQDSSCYVHVKSSSNYQNVDKEILLCNSSHATSAAENRVTDIIATDKVSQDNSQESQNTQDMCGDVTNLELQIPVKSHTQEKTSYQVNSKSSIYETDKNCDVSFLNCKELNLMLPSHGDISNRPEKSETMTSECFPESIMTSQCVSDSSVTSQSLSYSIVTSQSVSDSIVTSQRVSDPTLTSQSVSNSIMTSQKTPVRAHVNQLSLDSVQELPHWCTCEAVMSVHLDQHLDLINGNDVIVAKDTSLFDPWPGRHNVICYLKHKQDALNKQQRNKTGLNTDSGTIKNDLLGGINHTLQDIKNSIKAVPKNFVSKLARRSSPKKTDKESEISEISASGSDVTEDAGSDASLCVISRDVRVNDADSPITDISVSVTDIHLCVPDIFPLEPNVPDTMPAEHAQTDVNKTSRDLCVKTASGAMLDSVQDRPDIVDKDKVVTDELDQSKTLKLGQPDLHSEIPLGSDFEIISDQPISDCETKSDQNCNVT